jgi:hypothetical protein
MNKRLIYSILTIGIIAIALFFRKTWTYLPNFINIWIGDYLWAIMLYCATMVIFLNFNKKKTSIALIVFCWLIESSQLWHTPWLDAFRNTTFGGLLLGHGFLWSDIMAYTAGVLSAYWIDEYKTRTQSI